MPVQVWKCAFCSSNSKDKALIEEHESECTFNPKVKGCYTCKYRDDSGTMPMCAIDICSIGAGDCPDEEHCNKWKTVK